MSLVWVATSHIHHLRSRTTTTVGSPVNDPETIHELIRKLQGGFSAFPYHSTIFFSSVFFYSSLPRLLTQVNFEVCVPASKSHFGVSGDRAFFLSMPPADAIP
ncbi:hypothetical protein AAC387_Pa11g1566 [Persea americana]